VKLTELTRYDDAQRHFSMERLWALFDGDKEQLDLTHECVDRHAGDPSRVAVTIVHAEGGYEAITFAALRDLSSRLAHALVERGIGPGDRVAIVLEPSLAFYAGLFGAMRMGAIAVPLFTLFGRDGLAARLDDCGARLVITDAAHAALLAEHEGLDVVVADAAFLGGLARFPARFERRARADELAMFQYTSGTTRALPEAVRHTHRAIVLVTIAALYGTGVRPGDRFLCPSSPAWGHGLWHGTLAPLALGVSIAAYAGRFDADRLMRALDELAITNLSAAATHYRMMRNAGSAERYRFSLQKLSFTGEPIDPETAAFCTREFGRPVASMYGTTEIGVCLVDYPGAEDHTIVPGSLGKPVPGLEVEVQRADGTRAAPGEVGEIKLRRRGVWIATKDLGWTDESGTFFHGGRADDIIITAGWTLSPIEIEAALLRHPAVAEAAAIGVPDATRGQVVKAFVVARGDTSDALAAELAEQVATRLGRHSYPRRVAFVAALPKTPAGKVDRKALRARES
jgi:acetyl-CoA synthetase